MADVDILSDFADFKKSNFENAEINPELAARLKEASRVYREKFNKELPITSKTRTREEQQDLYNRFRKGEKGIYMPLDPSKEPDREIFHTDAVDISRDVPEAFLNQFGIHRPLGKKDPVHAVINPSYKGTFYEPPQDDILKQFEQDKLLLNQPEEEKTYQPGFYNPNLVAQGEQARRAGGGNLQPIVEGVTGALKSMSLEDWKKESTLANMLKYGVGEMPIVGDQGFHQEGRNKLIESGKTAINALLNPSQTYEAISQAEPGELLGQIIKNGIYDLPLGPSAKPVMTAASAVAKPVISAAGKVLTPAAEGFGTLQESFANAKKAINPTVSIDEFDIPKTMTGVGAANVSKQSSIANILPQLKPETQEFIKSTPTEKINLPALETKALEEKHGIKLSKGQRTEDVSRYADEWNHRAENSKTRDLFNDQAAQFRDALDNLKREHTPNMGNSAGEDYAQKIMDAYALNDRNLVKNIENSYGQVKARHNEILQERGLPPTEGMPLDTNQFVNSAKNRLVQEFTEADAESAGLMKDLDRIKENGLTFPEFVAFDKKLSRLQRSSVSGDRAAASHIRDAFDQIPLENGFEELLPLYQNAKALAKNRFDKLADIPGYKFAVEAHPSDVEIGKGIGSTGANKFYDKFIKELSTGDLKRVKQELINHPDAIEAMRGAELEKIVKAAGFTGDRGEFSPKRLHNYLETNTSNLAEKIGPEALNDLMEINVLGAKVGKPSSEIFNYSNSLSGLFGDLAKQGIQTKAESALALKTGGASILPIGIAKKAFEFMNKDKFVNETIHPHSGLIEEK